MGDILEQIVAHKRTEVAARKEQLPPAQLYRAVERQMEREQADDHPRRSMSRSLAASRSGIIAEFKRKSPSRGWIKEEGSPLVIPAAYSRAGAAAISILTDEKFFGGSLHFIEQARPTVDCPILRKDFVVDEYQLFEARMARADAVLLIAADLARDECRLLAERARELQLEVLLEVHTPAELEYTDCSPQMVGVNNRNLGSFHTDVENSFRLAELLPAHFVRVSESGISQPQTVRALRQAGFSGFLIGESFMRQPHPGEALARFIEEVER